MSWKHTDDIELEPSQQRRIAAKLRGFVDLHGSQERAADEIGIASSLFSKLLHAKRADNYLRPSTVDKIAEACNLTRAELLNGNAVLVS